MVLNLALGLALACVLLPAPAARAQTAQAPFTQAELRRFEADFPSVIRDLERAGVLEGDPADRDGLALAAQETTYRDVVTARGWDPERFAYVADHAARGLAALSVRDQAPDTRTRLDEARAQIMAMPDLTPEMRRQLLDQMAQAEGGLAGLEAEADKLPARELELIQADRARLDGLFRLP
ncbi:MAG: hypothetical protein AB7D57_13235 [Desulfovibrionaceae bacterium]